MQQSKKCKDLFSGIKTLGPKDNPSKYSIAKKLGSGCYGSVYIGYDDKNKSVAIKLLLNESDYQKEIKCLKYIQKICGKNILCYLDDFEFVNQQQNVYCIVTEYDPGYVRFSDYVEDNRPLSEEVIDIIIENVSDVLENLHEIEVAHNDLHEGNLLIHPETLEIKLIDFGSCIIFEYRKSDFYTEFIPEDDDQYILDLQEYLSQNYN